MRNREFFAYFAGLIDGEGTITIVRRGTKSFRPSLEVQISDKVALEFIKEGLDERSISAGVYKYPIDKRKLTYKQMYALKMGEGASILVALKHLIPFLVIKKQQAILLQRYVMHRRKHHKANGYHAGYSEKDLSFCKQIQKLNGAINCRRIVSDLS